MIDKLDAALRFEQEALGLRARRQEVIAANIANADTPGYKARDFDFGSELQRVVREGRDAGGLQLTTTAARHVDAGAALPTDTNLLFRVPAQPSIDGNTVEMDAERANFAENTLHYQAGLTVISSKIRSLLAALQQ